jgi:hypothetical protein
MKSRLMVAATAGVLTMVAAPVFAFGAPSLPATAKKLSAKEIVAIYDRSTFKFKDFTSNVPNTGTVTFNFNNKITSGTLEWIRQYTWIN